MTREYEQLQSKYEACEMELRIVRESRAEAFQEVERLTKALKQIEQDKEVQLHKWFADQFGEVMNGRDFNVKCSMAERMIEEWREDRKRLEKMLEHNLTVHRFMSDLYSCTGNKGSGIAAFGRTARVAVDIAIAQLEECGRAIEK